MSESLPPSRRRFLQASLVTAAGVALPRWSLASGAPAIIASDAERPQALQGVQLGDPFDGSIVVWSRSDRSARMLVDWSYDEQFRDAQRIVGPYALDTTDFTARQSIEGLEAGSDVFVRVTFQSLPTARLVSEPVVGRFTVPPDQSCDDDNRWRWARHGRNDVRFLWGGDTAGQGWGINPGFGGMKIYEAMRQRNPLFFIHSGDNIYADGPIAETA